MELLKDEEGERESARVDLPKLCSDLSLLELWNVGLGPGRVAVWSSLLESLAEVEKLEAIVGESFYIPRQVVVAVCSGGEMEKKKKNMRDRCMIEFGRNQRTK